MELQEQLTTLAANDIALFALSYDSVSILAAFATARGITYPLVSDEGSRFIRELGILNTRSEPSDDHYGIPYPGTYFIAEDGRVVDKIFHDTHRTRDATATTLREHFGLALPLTGPHQRQETDALVAIAAWDSDTFVRGERIGLRVTIQLAPGVHVYGRPLTEGYFPVTLEVEAPETVTVEPVIYPVPRPLRFGWLAEELSAYEGTLSLTTAAIFAEQREDVTLTVKLRFQACTDEDCYIPQRLSFAFPLRFRPFA